MPIYIRGSKQLLFMHIPKCAGTTVERAIEAHCDLSLLFNDSSAGPFPCSAQHFHREPLQHVVAKPESMPSFAIIRHPLSRCISEFTYRLRLSGAAGKKFSQELKSYFFEYKMNPYIYDNHIRPQLEFVFINTKVFRMEDQIERALDYAASVLCFERDTAGQDRHANRSDAHDFVLSGKDINKIQSFYRCDFDAFKYQMITIDDNETLLLSELKAEISKNLTCGEYVPDDQTAGSAVWQNTSQGSRYVKKGEQIARFIVKNTIKCISTK